MVELDTIHRFRNPWEADASLGLRHGDPAVLNTYVEFDRIRAAPLVEHLDDIASAWITAHSVGERLAITATTNEQVDGDQPRRFTSTGDFAGQLGSDCDRWAGRVVPCR